MTSERVIKMLSQLVMMILLARFIGAEKLGALMFCYTVVSLFGFLNSLGMEKVIIQKFIENKIKKRSYLKHGLNVRLLSGLFCFIFSNITGFFVVDSEYRHLVFIISLYHFFQPFEIYGWLFQSEGRSDLAAIGLIFSTIIGFVYICVCLFLGGDLIALGGAYVLEFLTIALVYRLLVNKITFSLHPNKLFSVQRVFHLVKISYPLMFSGAIAFLYMKIDQLMIGSMLKAEDVGVYVAGTRLSEAWYFIGLTLVGVYFPKFLSIKSGKNESEYYSSIIKYGRLLVWGGITLSIVTVFSSEALIILMYGENFLKSADVLNITIWAVPFVYLGCISSWMYVTASKQHLVFWRSLFGLIVNVVLNLILIRTHGVVGAAIATLVAQAFVGFIFNMFGSKSEIFLIQLSILSRKNFLKNPNV